MHAIKQKVTVQNGVIAFPARDLPDGSEVEVVVLSATVIEDEANEADEDADLTRLYLEAKAEMAQEPEEWIPLRQIIAEREAIERETVGQQEGSPSEIDAERVAA